MLAADSLLEAALRYAELNWYIFPLRKILTLPDGSKACTCHLGAKCASIGKHPAVKWKTEASCDPVTVRRWWGSSGGRFAGCGIGCATGQSGLVVLDLDGLTGVETFRHLSGGVRWQTARARTARGAHVFFAGDAPTSSDPVTKLDVRSTGGFVVLAPSPHASGHTYVWEVAPWVGQDALWIPDCPPALLEYARKKKPARGGLVGSEMGRTRYAQATNAPGKVAGAEIKLPDYLACASPDFGDRLAGILEAVDWPEVARALACIPATCKMDEWVRVGMALHQASNGSLQGLDIWDKWSSTGGEKYRGRGETEYSWSRWQIMPDGVGLGSLFALALQHGYKRREVMPTEQRQPDIRPPADVRAPGAVPFKQEIEPVSAPQAAPIVEHQGTNGHALDPATSEFFANLTSESDNPLIKLNKEYAVIGNVGGKCLVLSWENSPIDERVRVPAFQSFKTFSERFANQYVTVTKTKHLKDGDQEYEDAAQLGSQWLKWPDRRTYQAIELRPNAPEVLPNGNYNLWQGWGVSPRAREGGHGWDRMRDHIGLVLADGATERADYILKWSAWTVQNPGAPAGVACVTRGGQGAGKGVFGRAFCRMFGAHGMQIFHAKHLVGNFNAHMRNCLFMFADEAYWAGDKQGAAALKGLITEPVRILEQKGVDAIQWPNQVTLFMAANANWVVPAAHDERRYAVFDVSNARAQNLTYFEPLYQELKNGGLNAMLYDLLNMELGNWSPMPAIGTKALQAQKRLSLPPLEEWWLGLLQGHGERWMEFDRVSEEWPAKALMEGAREADPAFRTISDHRIADFLKERGATRVRRDTGSRWKLPCAREGREAFEVRFGAWEWEEWKGGLDAGPK